VIRRLYIHNFRCLENFELPLAGLPSVLLIGKNGSGKTTVSFALEILQKIARGTNRVKDLVAPKDFARGRSDVPMRFEIQIALGARIYEYTLALELPENFRELRVLEEKLAVDGRAVYTRDRAQVLLARAGQDEEAKFLIDWHLVALPIIQESSPNDPLLIFKQCLARMLVLRPVPSLITGDSYEEQLQPSRDITDFAAWFSGLLHHYPAQYSTIDQYLRQIMPDLKDIQNPSVGKDSRSITVQFSNQNGTLSVPFKDLADGEKCFIICAVVLAANGAYGPVLCFWDEPDNYLALSEVGHFVMALRRGFQSGGQFIATSHNPEAIGRFSDENTFVLGRKSRLEPTTVRPLSQVVKGDLMTALVQGDPGP
jgi:predicted ATPase